MKLKYLVLNLLWRIISMVTRNPLYMGYALSYSNLSVYNSCFINKQIITLNTNIALYTIDLMQLNNKFDTVLPIPVVSNDSYKTINISDLCIVNDYIVNEIKYMRDWIVAASNFIYMYKYYESVVNGEHEEYNTEAITTIKYNLKMLIPIKINVEYIITKLYNIYYGTNYKHDGDKYGW